MKLELEGYSCSKTQNIGYVCTPPIDAKKIQEQRDYWDQLIPYSYGYLDLIYDEKEISLGLIKKIKIVDEQNIEVTFATTENHKFMHATVTDYDYNETRMLSIGDTFIPKCHNQAIHVYKLHDIDISHDVPFAVFTYRIGFSDIDQCEFPQTLEHSFGVKFD